MIFALWFTLVGDQHLRQFLCERESKTGDWGQWGWSSLGTEHTWVSVPEMFQTKLRELLSLVVCAKAHISPFLQGQEQIKELERKWGPTDWLILQDKMQSGCSKSAFWPLHRCAQVIPPAARDHGWGRNLLFPEMCVAAHSLRPNTSKTKICSKP